MAVTKEILTLAVETGDALLRNGAEVYRVEDTVLHILKAYEITDCDAARTGNRTDNVHPRLFQRRLFIRCDPYDRCDLNCF